LIPLIPVLLMLLLCQCTQQKGKKSGEGEGTTLQQFFQYNGDGSVIISGHRGSWRNSIYPDNSLEGLQHATEQVPDIFFEVDPRLTKDSIIVLMHDASLERTTTAEGLLASYTLAELQDVRLKDEQGNVTGFKIPVLEEVINWSKGKTVLNLDRKDVPPQMIVELIKKCDAERDIMLTVHNGEQARFYYDRLPEVMLSARIRNRSEYDDFAAAEVPWRNMIAYVGQTIDEENRELVDMLHQQGVRCMTALSPTHDKLQSPAERAAKYREEISRGPDIIETDHPTELWQVFRDIKEKE